MIQFVAVKGKSRLMFLRGIPGICIELFFIALIAAAVLLFADVALAQTDSEDSLYSIELEKDVFLIPCPALCTAIDVANACGDEHVRETNVKLVPTESGFDTKGIWFEFVPEKGVVNGTGTDSKWNLSDAPAGEHWLRVKINRDFETIDVVSRSVEIRACDCVCAIQCSGISVESEQNKAVANRITVFRAVKQNLSTASDKLEWSVENGQIVSGAGTGIVKVRANDTPGAKLTVRSELSNDDPKCRQKAELSIPIISSNGSSQQ